MAKPLEVKLAEIHERHMTARPLANTGRIFIRTGDRVERRQWNDMIYDIEYPLAAVDAYRTQIDRAIKAHVTQHKE